MNGSANSGICCDRLFFHPCKIDASTLKGRTDRCYGGHPPKGQELKISNSDHCKKHVLDWILMEVTKVRPPAA